MEDHLALAPQVENQQIQYRQDGPRSLTDSFTILANASEVSRQSHPRTLFITILPRSTKGPRLKVNAGLQVSLGTTCTDNSPRRAGARLPPTGGPWGMAKGGAFSRRGEALEEAEREPSSPPSPSRPAAAAGSGREVGASPCAPGAASAATAAAAPRQPLIAG